MASIRRTLSPVSRAGALLNGEACSGASPLSKSSSCAQNHASSGGLLSSLFGSLDSQTFVVGVFSARSSRTLERSKPKGQVWRRSLFHFFLCFVVGVFIGVTPFVSMNLSMSLSKHQAFSFEQIPTIGNFVSYDNEARNVAPLDSGGLRNNATSVLEAKGKELIDGIGTDELDNQSLTADSNLTLRKLLIIVTPMYLRPFHAYYLNRLAQTLKLVPPPLLWLVVEMTSQSLETADTLRKSGVMYRHLVCSKNFTDTKDRIIHQRNVALSHIDTHRLDGIIYFADDDNIYSVELFEQMRNIRRFGTWMVAKWPESKRKTIVEGPICNGTQVIGWHIDEPTRRFRRFHAEMSGFAFNSTILWDPKRWHRPTLESIRQLHTVKEGFQVSAFVEQVVEDEKQMEGLMQNCSRILVWHLHLESLNSFYPRMWFVKNNLDVIVPLA